MSVEALTGQIVSRRSLDENWSFELCPSEADTDAIDIRLFLCSSCVCIASWKCYVPHLIGDVVGVLPSRFEQKILEACKKTHSSRKFWKESVTGTSFDPNTNNS